MAKPRTVRLEDDEVAWLTEHFGEMSKGIRALISAERSDARETPHVAAVGRSDTRPLPPPPPRDPITTPDQAREKAAALRAQFIQERDEKRAELRKSCHHPISRRIGKFCGECGADL